MRLDVSCGAGSGTCRVKSSSCTRTSAEDKHIDVSMDVETGPDRSGRPQASSSGAGESGGQRHQIHAGRRASRDQRRVEKGRSCASM